MALTNLTVNAQLPGFSFYKTLSIQASQVSGGTSLTDFPVLISHTDPDLRSITNGGKLVDINGYDISFTAADGTTLLEHQLEEYNQIKRFCDYMRKDQTSGPKYRNNFVQFITEYDKRRNKNFIETFPELKNFWEMCHDEAADNNLIPVKEIE